MSVTPMMVSSATDYNQPNWNATNTLRQTDNVAHSSIAVAALDNNSSSPQVSNSSIQLPRSINAWDVLSNFTHSANRNAPLFAALIIFLNIIQIVPISVMLVMTADDDCDIPLRPFLYSCLARLAFSITCTAFYMVDAKWDFASSRLKNSVKILRIFLDLLLIGLVIFGNYLVFIRNTCQFTSPGLFYLSFAIIVLNYLTIAFPIFLFVTILLSGRRILMVDRNFNRQLYHKELLLGTAPDIINQLKLRRVQINNGRGSKSPASEKSNEKCDLGASSSSRLIDNVNLTQNQSLPDNIIQNNDNIQKPANAFIGTRRDSVESVTVIELYSQNNTTINEKQKLDTDQGSIYSTISENGTPIVVIPSTHKSSSSLGNGSYECSICLDNYQHQEQLRKLNCNHYFHQTCIDHWLTSNRTCPLCKFDVVHDYWLSNGKSFS